MTMRAEARGTRVEVGAALFRGLGDVSRLSILRELLDGERRVVDLTEHLGLAQSTVSAHLACLRGCGLVASRPEGRSTWWRAAAPEELSSLLRAAEHLLEAVGEGVDLCPTYGSQVP